MMGMHGEAWVNTAIQEADLLIALGMRFDDRVTGNVRTYARQAKKIHIDVDAAEIGKIVPVDVGIVGDLCDVLGSLVPGVEAGQRKEWIARIDYAQGRLRGPRHSEPCRRRAPVCGARHERPVARDQRPRGRRDRRRPAPDVGSAVLPSRLAADAHHIRAASGTMGFALPAAIGAKVSRPDAEVWTIAGDGGFQMTMPELATIKQEGLDVKIAVINNGFLGMVRQWQEFFYERRYAATPLLSPDFAKIAEAYGLHGVHGQDARRGRAGDRGRARASGNGPHRLPGRAGGHGLPDGARRRRPPRDDSPAVGARGDRDGRGVARH